MSENRQTYILQGKMMAKTPKAQRKINMMNKLAQGFESNPPSCRECTHRIITPEQLAFQHK